MTTTNTLPGRRTMVKAVLSRDASWRGAFVFGVTTTKVFCRPGCPAKSPLPHHVEFFNSIHEAEKSGYRPCLRCRPSTSQQDPDWWRMALSMVAESSRGRIGDAQLREAGLDPTRIRRYSMKIHGMTFHSWCRHRKIANAQRKLRKGSPVDGVILDSGYDSYSGFRTAFAQVTGSTPSRNRAAEPISLRILESPLGQLVTGAVEEGVCLLEFGDRLRVQEQAHRLARQFGGPVVDEPHPLLDKLKAELSEFWNGRLKRFTVPLAIRGTEFERDTWAALCEIPWGETRSYLDVARAIGRPGAMRAVGSANGRNRIAIVIPCHRVVNANGKLGGYGGGLWRKERLLELERTNT